MEQKYLGITPYDENGSFEFAGRNEETWALFDRVVRNDYTVYYAASGEGKSSLIRAGLLPILRRRDFFPVYIVFEDKELDDLSAIENIINSRIEVETKKHKVTYEQSIWSKTLFNQEVSDLLKGNMWWRLRNYCFKRGDTELKPLFIFDQFEEVFTKANYGWTDHFFAWLEGISTDYIPDSLREVVNSLGIDMPVQKNFKALFSFRTEYIGDLDYWCVQKHFIPPLQENRMCLKPLTPQGAKEIINLNESLLGKYADKIIQGCAESKANTGNESQPCVYALILSVICQTLSEISDSERVHFLDRLNKHQEDTINDILLRFYKKKLLAAGLDYNKNEEIIADIENALVDEKGKRSRRDTDEVSMQFLAKWIERLCDKSNGLLKVIERKVVDGRKVMTVEFPHDRLCKAIDSSRKERQGKNGWRLNRQEEWIQFGVISTIMGIIAFLWNALMPSIKPVISNSLRKVDLNAVISRFVSNYIWEWKPSEYNGYSLDEGYSTLLLMVSFILFIPLITICIGRKSKKWQILNAFTSITSCLSFVFLWLKNRHISFANNYVVIFTFIGLLFSIASLCMSILKLRIIYTKGEYRHPDKLQYSNWPLWGGYLIFGFYVFYEFLVRTTFGTNEPCDSSWALLVLPLLYTLWAWGFFNLEFDNNVKTRMRLAFLLSVLFLCALWYISDIPSYNRFKQLHGFNLSIVLILLWLVVSIYMLWRAKSKTNYYSFSTSKRLLATIIGAVLLTTTFILNLGYNPIAISPRTVCHVASWRDVLVYEKDSLVGKKFGILYSANGKIIVPCCIPKNDQYDTLLAKGETPFGDAVLIESKFIGSPFREDTITKNDDGTLKWNPDTKILTAFIPVASTLEEYLHRKLGDKNPVNSSFRDSIDYYAAKLFCEMRDANIAFVIERKPYNLEVLESFEMLDSLQHIALSNELRKFSLGSQDIVVMSGKKIPRMRIDVLEDKHLIDLHRELSRSFLLCMIKDRVLQSDMPSMFTLAKSYLMAYFTSVPSMNMELQGRFTTNIMTNINSEDKIVTGNVEEIAEYKIYSDDILNGRFFAWYHLFNFLCDLDICWNTSTTYKGLVSEVERFNEVSNDIAEEWKSVVKTIQTLPELSREVENLKDAQKDLLVELKSIKNTQQTTTENIIEESANLWNAHHSLLEKVKKMKEVISPSYLESHLKRYEEFKLLINTVVVDQSFDQLIKEILSSLLPIMRARKIGVYNNDFENICKKLLIVSATRGNDIQNDAKKFSEYLSEKNSLYDVTNKINQFVHRDFPQLKKEKEERLKTKIALLELL